MDGGFSHELSKEEGNTQISHASDIPQGLSNKAQDSLCWNGNVECSQQNLSLDNASSNSSNDKDLIENSMVICLNANTIKEEVAEPIVCQPLDTNSTFSGDLVALNEEIRHPSSSDSSLEGEAHFPLQDEPIKSEVSRETLPVNNIPNDTTFPCAGLSPSHCDSAQNIPTLLSLEIVDSSSEKEPNAESISLVEPLCKKNELDEANYKTTPLEKQIIALGSTGKKLEGANTMPTTVSNLKEDCAKDQPKDELTSLLPMTNKQSQEILSPLMTYSLDLEALDLETTSFHTQDNFLKNNSFAPRESSKNFNKSETAVNGINQSFSNDIIQKELNVNNSNLVNNLENSSFVKYSTENTKSLLKLSKQNVESKQGLSNSDFCNDKKSNNFIIDNLSLKSSDLESDEDWPLAHSRLQEVEKLEIQMDILEANNKTLRKENDSLKEKLINQEKEFQRQVELLKSDLSEQLDKVRQHLSHAQRERDNMVVKYAQGEREVMKTKKLLEESEKRVKDLLKQTDHHLTKIKNLSMEKAKLASTLDIKLTEISNLQKENERLKEEIKSRDIKIKWGQNKLKTEMDAHKDTQAKLEASILRQKEMREEAQQVRADCQEMMRHLQAAEEARNSTPLPSLSSTESENLLRRDLEATRQKLQAATEENNALTLKIHSVEKERLEHEETLSRLKEQLNAALQEVADVRARMTELEDLQIKLEREADRVQALQREADRLRTLNADLQADMEACRAKEGELLQFTERLTTKSVRLQSDHTLLEAKAQQSKDEALRLSRHCQELESSCKSLEEELQQVRKQKDQEIQLLIHRLADKTKSVEMLTTRLEEAENEASVLKRRHLTTVKALSRELQHSKRRLESLDGGESRLTTGTISRASSNSSLDASHSHQPESPKATMPQIDQRLLIERIIKLQKNLERKTEKLEFFQEHINVLHNELKKKSKIIQNYILREETGALAPSAMDNNKVELMKRGGVMASVYGSHPADGTLTLELSLEINNKLQSVLEETLLKNITLKENINTLGQEIARLSAQRTGSTP